MSVSRFFTPRRHRLLLVTLDALAVFAVFNLILWLRGARTWGELTLGPLAVPFLLLSGMLYLIDGYRAGTAMLSLDYTSQHAMATGAALLGTYLLTFVVFVEEFPLQGSRVAIALSFLALGPLTLGYRRSLRRLGDRGQRESTLLFLGDEASGRQFAATCAAHGMRQRVLVHDFEREDGAAAAAVSLRELADLADRDQSEVEAIVLRESSVALRAGVADRLVELFYAGVPTLTLELFYETYWRKVPLYRLNHVWLFREGFRISRSPVYRRIKRVTDVALAGGGLLLASPILLLAGLAIRVADRGPVFYRQERVGRNRRVFRILKLRTMVPGADALGQSAYTQTNDARVTRVGAWLRKTRCDEVPQLWNVLKGEMSLIGPRAEWLRLVDQYEREIPCYHFRHLVRPGITGWAQVNYPYGSSIEDTVRKLEYDLFYIRHFSFRMDASIILKTVHLMLFARGK